MYVNINLSTQTGYSISYLASGRLSIEGFDGFISIELGKADVPSVTLIGFTVSGQSIEPPKKSLSIGDTITIGKDTYQLCSKRTRYIHNGDLFLAPVEA